MWPDNETGVDLLGFEVHAELLAGLVTNPALLPVTVGLFGDWGGGKSSVMRMLKDRLEAQEGVACLYFNGWTFEGYDDAKTALITSILIELGEHKRFLPELRGRVAHLLKRINYMRMASVIIKHGSHAASAAGGLAMATGFLDPHTAAAVMGAGVAVSHTIKGAEEALDESAGGEASEAVDKIAWGELIEQDPTRPEPLDIRTFRRDFGQLLTDSKVSALVVLIDDLDRCSPERLIENLEAIKLFLAVPRSAFVIAADERIVRHAVATRYAAQHSDSADLVTDYVEKLVQVPYHLPRLSASEIETYISLLFCQLYAPDATFEGVRSDCAEKRRKAPRQTYGIGAITDFLGDTVSDDLGRSLQWGRTIAPILAEGLKGNPRQVKRMLNALLLRRRLADVASLSIRDEVLVKLMLLEYSRPTLIQELYMWQTVSDGRPEQLERLEKAARDGEKLPDEFGAWDEQWVHVWLSLDPGLAGVDLGDYFWVARDRIRADIAAVATVSPAVRRIYESLVAADEIGWRMTMKEAEALDPDDQAVLASLLSAHILRHPDQDSPIRSLVGLAEIKAPGAGATLIQTMLRVTVATLHANAPRRLESAIEADASLRVGLTPVLKLWASGGSPAARAAQRRLDRLNQQGGRR